MRDLLRTKYGQWLLLVAKDVAVYIHQIHQDSLLVIFLVVILGRCLVVGVAELLMCGIAR